MVRTGEKRVALVIGNAAYEHAAPLETPVNDARAIGSALSRLGFSVAKPQFNLDCIELQRALRAFSAAAKEADIAAIYFAGHGIEVDGRNFLIPTDAKLQRASDINFAAVPLDQLLAAVEGASKLGLVVLDACRSNPFRARMLRSGGTRSIGRGLHAIAPDGAVLLACAAKYGTYAVNGRGSHSPFTEALLTHIETPGMEITQLFREVREEVLELTRGKQEPYVYGSLEEAGFCLRPLQPLRSTRPKAASHRRPQRSHVAAFPSLLKFWMAPVAAGVAGAAAAIIFVLWL